MTNTNRQPQKNKNSVNLFLNEYFQIIIAVSLILFLALAYFIVLGPRFSIAQEAIRTNIENEKNLYANNLRKLESYRAINEVYKKMNPEDLRRFNTVLPDTYVPERLFGEIEEIVSRGGWLVSGLKIIAPEEALGNSEGAALATSSIFNLPENVSQHSVELKVGALDYAGFQSLLRILENNLRLFDIASVEFSPSNASAKIILTTYYYKRAQ